MSTPTMKLVPKKSGTDWYSPYRCEYRSTAVCLAVLSTSEYQSGPYRYIPRDYWHVAVLAAVLGHVPPLLSKWYWGWYSEDRCSVPFPVPLNRADQRCPMRPGEGEKSPAARICRRAAALYECRAREAVGRSRIVGRSMLGLGLLVAPFAAAGGAALVRDASSNPASAQVSGSALALCHKLAHNSVEIGAKSARRGRCTSADHLGGGHCA